MTLKISQDTFAQNFKFVITTQIDFFNLQIWTYQKLKISQIGQKHYSTRILRQTTSNQISCFTKTYNYSICTI